MASDNLLSFDIDKATKPEIKAYIAKLMRRIQELQEDVADLKERQPSVDQQTGQMHDLEEERRELLAEREALQRAKAETEQEAARLREERARLQGQAEPLSQVQPPIPRPAWPCPPLFRSLQEYGDAEHTQFNIPKIPNRLVVTLRALRDDIVRGAGGGRRPISVKDWVVWTNLLRAGAVVAQSCPDLMDLYPNLTTFSTDELERQIRESLFMHLAKVFDWHDGMEPKRAVRSRSAASRL